MTWFICLCRNSFKINMGTAIRYIVIHTHILFDILIYLTQHIWFWELTIRRSDWVFFVFVFFFNWKHTIPFPDHFKFTILFGISFRSFFFFIFFFFYKHHVERRCLYIFPSQGLYPTFRDFISHLSWNPTIKSSILFFFLFLNSFICRKNP